MNYNELKRIVEQFPHCSVLVVGDVMLDKTIKGKVERVSPEAPVPIINVLEEKYAPGGAANAAANIAALEGHAILLGVVGNDKEKEKLIEELEKRKISHALIMAKDRPTITKVRVLGRNQHMIRIDYEKTKKHSEQTKKAILSTFEKYLGEVQAIVFSDYAKGMNDKEIIEKMIQLAKQHNKLMVADFKSKNYEIYRGVDIITPNKHDSAAILKMPKKSEEDIKNLGEKLKEILNCDVLMTRGSKGMSLFDDEGHTTISTKAKEVYDTTGAGDTVVGALTLSLIAGANLKQAAQIATHAASQVIAKAGTETCERKKLQKEIEKNTRQSQTQSL